MDNDYSSAINTLYSSEEEFSALNLAMTPAQLENQLRDSLTKSREHWNQWPYSLEATDNRATKYLFPNLAEDKLLHYGQTIPKEKNHDDSVLFESWRAILSYATGQLGVPELLPSRTDTQAARIARNMGLAVYQHSLDEHVDFKVRSAAGNVISRKRGILKVRYDSELDDVVTDVVPPEDLIFDRFAGFMADPNAIHHRIYTTVDELCAKYPPKANRIYQLFAIKQGRFSQTSKRIAYFETWYTYVDAKYKKRQAVASWLESPSFLELENIPNPNWIYTGMDQKDRQANFTKIPPKPFVWINYLNMGKSVVDETCLFDQAIPTQDLLNSRNRQWHRNIDLVNGRWLYDKGATSEGIATRFVNEGQKSILGFDANGKPLDSFMKNLAADPLPAEVYESILDLRQRIKDKMGTPNQFQGQDSGKQNTLGRDLLIKQQAGALQDDFVRAIQNMYGNYYELKLQIMQVAYTSNKKFMVKTKAGHEEVLLGPSTFDPNVKVGIRTDSTLPLDKASIRQSSAALSSQNKIALVDLYRDLGYPDPEERAEATLRSQIDPIGYLTSVEQGIEQSDARDDIDALLKGDEPKDRDVYDQKYIDAYNLFITTNEFSKLTQSMKQSLLSHLMLIQHIASQQTSLQEAMLDDAGMSEAPITPPAPVRQIRITGQLPPQDSEQVAGIQSQSMQSPPGVPSAPIPPGAK